MLGVLDVDILICSLLDNETIKQLYLLGLIPNLEQLARSNWLWYCRVRYLTIQYALHLPNYKESSNWKMVYGLVLDNTEMQHWCLYNEEDEPLIVKIYSDYPPVEDEIVRAAANNKPKLLQALLHQGLFDPNLSKDMTALSWAVAEQNEQCVRVLLADGRVDPTLDDNMALIHACIGSSIQIMNMLLQDKRISFSSDVCRSCLRAALKYEDYSGLRLLLEDEKMLASLDNSILEELSKHKGSEVKKIRKRIGRLRCKLR